MRRGILSSLGRNFFSSFGKEINLRNDKGIPPLPLNVEQVSKLCNLLENPGNENKDFLYEQFSQRIVPGVDDTSLLKAQFLFNICKNKIKSTIISNRRAVNLLGTMQGGYNVNILVNLLDDDELSYYAYKELSKTILIFDSYNDVVIKANKGNYNAKRLLRDWAEAKWFKSRSKLPERMDLSIFKVSGEINTDDLSPAQDAWSRPDIPLHSLSMLKVPRTDIEPDLPYETGPIKQISEIKDKGYPVAFVGDIVGTGSSRKSATNSLLWHFGNPINFVPNKNTGSVCIGNKIAPIFYNTMEDSGALPIEMNVDNMRMGDIVSIYPYEGETRRYDDYALINKFELKATTIDNVRAGGRINLIIGKALTNKAQEYLKKHIVIFNNSEKKTKKKVGYTLAQKIVGKACGIKDGGGILPGNYCEPIVTSVGSQDTTGPMTRDELKDLACLGFTSDLVMQSFCHTAAYPKPVDIVTHNTLPEFINNRGGISLKPGDGIIHSWLNRMLLPDTVGTGGDSHTRFPIGISFPAGSGLVAFAATTGIMPLDMPESVLVKFKGEMQPGITIRDLVHSIPYFAIKNNLLTIGKNNKKNVFNGKILEIEGLPNLTCEQAFELSDASAERSAAGCTIKLNNEPVIEYLESNITLLEWMIKNGYKDEKTIERRINKMKEWLNNPNLMTRDDNAEYAEILEINLNDIKEPILCAPNDPDKAVLLSEVSGDDIDEVFIGSCMTNIGHFRAAGKLLDGYEGTLKTKLWMAPPTKMDEKKLKDEGFYDIYKKYGVKLEMPGCSLCMGNQARVNDRAKVLSTSTRNFPNRLGKGADVYLASAELSAITAIEGRIPDKTTYLNYFNKIEKDKSEIFTYLNFNRLPEYI
tara:strand:- start:2237 stop:4837 length:2601 start_codon:yes stop_codon:yes gene_type:complete